MDTQTTVTRSLDDIARRHYEEEAARFGLIWGRSLGEILWFAYALASFAVIVAVIFGVGLYIGVLVALLPADVAGAVWLAIVSGLVLLAIPTSHLLARRRIFKGLAAFRAGEPDAVRRVCEFAVEEFRYRIKTHRARTLGSDSEWSVARTSLAEKADEAQRSVTYWRIRVHEEPENSVAATQLQAALDLDDKLRTAMLKLDARADALLQFYNVCEAKVALMDRYGSDIAEIRRLEHLSGEADMAVATAEIALADIGHQFIQEAEALGQALGGFERIQVKSLAGEAQLENIEYLADRIIQSSDAERRAVEDLDIGLRKVGST